MRGARKSLTGKIKMFQWKITKTEITVGKTVSVDTANELLKLLGHDNIQLSHRPVFNWNGNCVTDDETAPVKIMEDNR